MVVTLVHDTGSSNYKSHATGDSIVPESVQKAVPEGLEKALPDRYVAEYNPKLSPDEIYETSWESMANRRSQ